MLGTIGFSRYRQSAGFSLIELLVALAIGMLAVLVISQTFLFFEGQKRATTGTANAQVDGNIALYSISRELQMGGWGLMPVVNSAFECNRIEVDHDGNAGTATIDAVSPVVILDGVGVNGSDDIVIRAGQSPGVPVSIVSLGGGAGEIVVNNNFGCGVGDVALITNGNACSLTQVTALSAAPAAGAAAAPASITVANSAGAVAAGEIACLGAWQQSIYSVVAGGLSRNGAVIVPNVVDVQAQYGISAAASSNQVTQWVNATGIWAASALTVANRNRIKAVRIAVIARNSLLERDPVSTACSSISLAQPTGVCAWDATSANPAVASPAPTVDLSGDPDWDRYRYRVFETIIPLRNVIWSRDTL